MYKVSDETQDHIFEPKLATAIEKPIKKARMEYDVVEAQAKFGIFVFRDYHGILIRKDDVRFIFQVRFLKVPRRIYRVSCPAIIHAGILDEVQRQDLWIKLDAARDWIPQNDWTGVGMKREDRFLVLG
ncbi:hypothetical protein AAWM_10486 [Aspergillus awamori]|uniref:Uncharacterized protein n=1 Tax=Aspergillus awamori TaxID=105351 RepID=A0A401L7Q3_ASPAW|nr:hypothetical protein AAWM_10486 [Aspergillus awamori]